MFVRQLAGGLALMLVVFRTAPAAANEKPSIPKGSEKAVNAVRNEFAKAEIDDIVEPKGFGGSGGKGTPMFWSIRFHVGDAKHELSVLPDGTIIRLPSPVALKDLPKPVAEAVAPRGPSATPAPARPSADP